MVFIDTLVLSNSHNQIGIGRDYLPKLQVINTFRANNTAFWNPGIIKSKTQYIKTKLKYFYLQLQNIYKCYINIKYKTKYYTNSRISNRGFIYSMRINYFINLFIQYNNLSGHNRDYFLLLTSSKFYFLSSLLSFCLLSSLHSPAKVYWHVENQPGIFIWDSR